MEAKMLSGRLISLLSPALLLPMACAASPADCQPVRLGVEINNPKTFRKDAVLEIHIQTQGAKGQACKAASPYKVTLRVTASSRVLYDSNDGRNAPITIPAGYSDPISPNNNVRVSLKLNNQLVTGHITIEATAAGLLSGAASLSASAAEPAQPPRILRAAYWYSPLQRVQDDAGRIVVSLVLYGGPVVANGQDYATLLVYLDRAPAKEVTLYFPGEPSSWDGKVTIPAGQTELTSPIHITSKAYGMLTIDKLLKAGNESLFRFDSSSSCKIDFVPPGYALLLFEPKPEITLGNSVTITVTLMTPAKVPLQDFGQLLAGGPLPLRITNGSWGNFEPVAGQAGVYKFTPVAFGNVSMMFQRGDMLNTETLSGDQSTVGPAVLQVSFPFTWLILSFAVSLGATALNPGAARRKRKAGVRYLVGGVAGMLLMLALTQLLLPLIRVQIPVNTIAVCLVSFAGGWGGSSAIDAFSSAVTGTPTDTPEPPSLARGHSG
jgi:hypothetical protein